MSLTYILDKNVTFTHLHQFITISTRSLFNLHKIFVNHPQSIKNSSDNPKQFKLALKNYLYVHSFYSVEE